VLPTESSENMEKAGANTNGSNSSHSSRRNSIPSTNANAYANAPIQRPLEINPYHTGHNNNNSQGSFDRHPMSPSRSSSHHGGSTTAGGGIGAGGSFPSSTNNQQRLHHKAFRRNSIATMDTRLVPLNSAAAFPAAAPDQLYNDLTEITKLTRQKLSRRSSMSKVDSKVESEIKLRYSLASMMDYKDQNDNLQRLRERFQQSRTSVLSSGNGQRSSVIGSVVGGGGGGGTKMSDEEFSMDFTTGTPRSVASIPVSLVEQTIRRKRLDHLERENLIESLVNFACHTPRAVLEDLITREIQLWEDSNKEDIEQLLQDDDNKSRNFDSEADLDDFEDASLSSLSSEENKPGDHDKGGGGGGSHAAEGSISKNENVRRSSGRSQDLLEQKLLLVKTPNSLPSSRERHSALLFVDINGFTKLSTMLDVESLSKAINSYFEMIVTEVILYGGDVLKFAGDAIFAEWRPNDEEDNDDEDDKGNSENHQHSNDKSTDGYSGENETVGLKRLNASLSSSGEISWGSLSTSSNIENNPRKSNISTCVLQAAKCAASIVRKYSDYHVGATSRGESLVHGGGGSVSEGPGGRNDAMLNVHCGIGAGHMIGLHVGDYREGVEDDGQEEEAVELRREYLFLGNAINQVSQLDLMMEHWHTSLLNKWNSSACKGLRSCAYSFRRRSLGLSRVNASLGQSL
jgi:class 3 adenylate cyclase